MMSEEVAFVAGIRGLVSAHLAARLKEGTVEIAGLRDDLKKRPYLDLSGIKAPNEMEELKAK